MKKQFKLTPALGVEFSIVRKKNFSKTKVDAADDFSDIDLYATKKQFLEIAKGLPQSPGLLILSSKKQEILKVMVCGLSIRERFLALREEREYVKFLFLIKESGTTTVTINYAREKRA